MNPPANKKYVGDWIMRDRVSAIEALLHASGLAHSFRE